MSLESSQKDRIPSFVVLILGILLFLTFFLGQFWPHWMLNGECYALVGCNDGFFGYDGIVHFVSSIAEVVALIWLAHNFPNLDFFHKSFWKNFVVLISLACLIAVVWELVELGADQYYLAILHVDVIRLNVLAQPNNIDTMGDMGLSLVGAAGTALVLRSRIKKKE